MSRANGMVEAESIEWNAGGDSSDQGTQGMRAGDSSNGMLCMSRINVIFLTNLENWPISVFPTLLPCLYWVVMFQGCLQKYVSSN